MNRFFLCSPSNAHIPRAKLTDMLLINVISLGIKEMTQCFISDECSVTKYKVAFIKPIIIAKLSIKFYLLTLEGKRLSSNPLSL